MDLALITAAIVCIPSIGLPIKLKSDPEKEY
jgi:hypothetical protein